MADAPVTVRVVRLSHAADLPLPEGASPESAGLDVRAATESDIVLDPGSRARVPTGLVLEIPRGWEGQVRPRSGLAARHGVTVANSPGTIDSDYRGEVQILLVNLGREPLTIRRGDRVAQLVISAVATVNLVEVNAIDGTDRGDGGFGSTGLS